MLLVFAKEYLRYWHPEYCLRGNTRKEDDADGFVTYVVLSLFPAPETYCAPMYILYDVLPHELCKALDDAVLAIKQLEWAKEMEKLD
jgi:hypothetical protein